ncbi:radical SAM protein [Mesorhizobium sp. M8A.F.Ca.ET.021.01.1.1]|uniref:B12-binding domain-containing radical SAM protein n=1 Tax=Mesorhizobium sp. M8A.F.Ca.ET.021.01.1.1 TaxID=2496757 RepID=UPI000FCA0667|nr:radical SAM protein [Mesorhizobium sp. M8A.F.Ca.ET.021.01.1.1]RUW57011.1 B12-binding domain-containing radical SAM protein [Mesorhizobium sp. M8A.F.Ca.ET.021.01.1.1]
MRVILSSTPYVDYGSWLSESRVPRTIGYIPIGLLSLASVLRDQNHTVSLFRVSAFWEEHWLHEGPIGANYERAADAILIESPDLVGFSTEYYTFHHVAKIAAEIKRRSPRTVVILGGPQATATPEATLKLFPQFDLIVRGESEVTLLDLVDALESDRPLADVPGLCIRTDGTLVRTASRRLIDSLDTLPVPAFDLVPIAATDLVSIEAGRGCPFSCAFCSTNNFWHRRYRIKSPARLCDELEHLQQTYGVTNFSLIHDCLTANRREVVALCDEITRRQLAISWGCSSRTDTMDVELAELMAAAGFTNVYFGLESGDPDTQKAIKKNLDLDASFSLIRQLRARGVQVTTPFMVGFPGETYPAVKHTFSAINRALMEDVFLAQIFATAPYGDTPMLESYTGELSFSGHFIDVSQSASEVAIRDELMRENPSVFSGHFRYQTSGIGHLIEGADQFFPLMNEYRYTYTALNQLSDDPLYVFEKWSEWLRRSDRTNSKLASFRHYGTFEEFQAFLHHLIAFRSDESPFLTDLFDYENTRLRLTQGTSFRETHNPHLIGEDTGPRIRLAPAIVLKRYTHDILAIIEQMRRQDAPPSAVPFDGTIALAIRDGRLTVYQSTGFAAEVLAYSADSLPIEDLVYRVSSRQSVAGEDAVASIRANCLETITSLESTGLIHVD